VIFEQELCGSKKFRTKSIGRLLGDIKSGTGHRVLRPTGSYCPKGFLGPKKNPLAVYVGFNGGWGGGTKQKGWKGEKRTGRGGQKKKALWELE